MMGKDVRAPTEVLSPSEIGGSAPVAMQLAWKTKNVVHSAGVNVGFTLENDDRYAINPSGRE